MLTLNILKTLTLCRLVAHIFRLSVHSSIPYLMNSSDLYPLFEKLVHKRLASYRVLRDKLPADSPDKAALTAQIIGTLETLLLAFRLFGPGSNEIDVLTAGQLVEFDISEDDILACFFSPDCRRLALLCTSGSASGSFPLS